MTIGVISDTHGNLRLMHQSVDRMVDVHGVEVLFHAGDDYLDAEALAMSGRTVHMVPGLGCPQYRDPRVPNRIRHNVDGLTISMAHADKDLRALELAASVVIIGHTHVARVDHLGRSIHLNPGHLKCPVDRGERASFAIIETGGFGVSVAVYELTGKPRREVRVRRSALA